MIIESRLGKQEIDEERLIHFPKGIIGFEHLRTFVILRIHDSSPFLVLQSTDDPAVGLMVADPFTFMPGYYLELSDAEQAKLQAEQAEDLAVLVTVSIPTGRPDETALNLMGPIIINHKTKIGLQAPQGEKATVDKVYVKTCLAEMEEDKKPSPEKNKSVDKKTEKKKGTGKIVLKSSF